MKTIIILAGSNIAQRNEIANALKKHNDIEVKLSLLEVADIEASLKELEHEPHCLFVLTDTQQHHAQAVTRFVKSRYKDTRTILITPYGIQLNVEKLLEMGADDFLQMPFDESRLRWLLMQQASTSKARRYARWLERKVSGHIDLNDVIGSSDEMRQAKSLAATAAIAKMPVWIQGGSGAGKEWLARAIHGAGPRAGNPFIVVHCDLLPENKADETIFGSETDMGSHKAFVLGKLREAHRGTILFKEIQTLSSSLQQQLLSLLEEGFYTVNGSNNKVPADVRIMCSVTDTFNNTRRKPIETVLQQRLRQTVVQLPDLMGRQEDIVSISEHFLAMYSASEMKHVTHFSDNAVRWLKAQKWPGNVRQLAHIIHKAVITCDHATIDERHIRCVVEHSVNAIGPINGQRFNKSAAFIDNQGDIKPLRSVEKEAISFALTQSGGCFSNAAKKLGIGRSTLYRKVQAFDINVS